MKSYTQSVINVYRDHANSSYAGQQKKYMKNKFEFFGLPSPYRRELNRKFLTKTNLPEKQEAFLIIKELWQQPQRELQYFALDLAEKYVKQPEEKDIAFYTYLITHKSWWDTVDFIAATLVGSYFRMFSFERESIINKWLNSGNIWLQRTSLIFQLKYKTDTDALLLYKVIRQLLGTKEFFINKAIGWSLREYSKTDSKWVIQTVEKLNDLSYLSRKEALKVIEKQKKKI